MCCFSLEEEKYYLRVLVPRRNKTDTRQAEAQWDPRGGCPDIPSTTPMGSLSQSPASSLRQGVATL